MNDSSTGHERAFAPALLLIGLVFAVNLNALCADFVWDDRALVTGNILIKHWDTLPVLFREPFLGLYYRPVVMLSFALEYALWGLRPWGFHLTNLLLHAANSVMVFHILRHVSRSRGTAFVAALLFASHPVHKGIVAIADRTGVLSAFFFLCSILLYVQYRRSEDTRGSVIFYAGSLVLCGLGFFSKEEVITLPLVLILVDSFVLDRRQRPTHAARVAGYVPFFLLAAVYLWIRAHVLGEAGGIAAAFATELARRLITIPAVMFDYLLLLLFPFHLDYDPRTPLAESIGDPRILLPLLFVIAVAAVIPWLARKTKTGLFGLLWYTIVFIPMSNILPIYAGAARSELFTPIHFLYLPSIGVFLCAADGFEKIFGGLDESGHARRWRRPATLALCCVLLLFSLLSIKRNFIWKDELRLYRYIVEMHPENHRMRLNLGNVYLERGQVDAGLEQLKQAVILAPDVASYRNSVGLAYKARGWLDRSVEEFREALRLDPDFSMAYMNLTVIYRMQGRLSDAIAAGRKAVELAPSSVTAHVNLGLAYKDSGDLARAEKQFEMAVRSDPDSAEAHNGLGIVYALQGRHGPARKEWEETLRIRPDMTEARENLRRLERMGY